MADDLAGDVVAAVPVVAAVGRRRGQIGTSWTAGVAGGAGLLLAWELIALYWLHQRDGVPTPVAVARVMWHDLTSHYIFHVASLTVKEALQGFVVADVAAIALAIAFVQFPPLERLLLRLTVATYCLPLIALVPILSSVFGSQSTAPRATIAALLVFFTTLVGTLLGLRSADASSLELVRAYGGGSWAQLRKVRLKSALPYIMAALRIAAPTAVLGALIGEELGAGGGGSGIGVVMISTQQRLQVADTWALAGWATLLAGLGYVIVGLVGRAVVPWSATGRRS